MNQTEQVKIQYAKVDKLASRINFQQAYSTNSQSFYS